MENVNFSDFMTSMTHSVAKLESKVDSVERHLSGLLGLTTSGERPYLTKSESAKLLRCSISTIDNYRREGKLTRVRLGGDQGRKVLFHRQQVLALAGIEPVKTDMR